MKQLGSLQSKLTEMKEEMEKTTAEGTSGAGMVKVIINGAYQVKKVEISDELMGMNDKGMLEVLIASAFNDASEHMKAKIEEQSKGMASSMGLNF